LDTRSRASRRHARIRLEAGTLTVRDLGSRNGTRVDKSVVRDAERQLAGGEAIRVGDVRMFVALTRGAGRSSELSPLEAEVSRLAGEGSPFALVRIAVQAELARTALLEVARVLGPSARIEPRDDGEIIALVAAPEDPPIAAALAAALPHAVITFAREGCTAAALLEQARARAGDTDPEPSGAGVVVADPAMQKVWHIARRLGATDTTVLVLGETGVGKELVAELVHRASARHSGPFVRLNCAALPDTLLEGELFGHEKGAFTGADRRKVGYLEAAHQGTLFLDELGEVALSAQVKLLRFLETRAIQRIGSAAEVTVDVRVVCATHRDLTKAVAEGRFREDLYYRISAFTIEVPPLRERPREIPLLAVLFARQVAARLAQDPPAIDPSFVAALLRHRWPGNVRELRNAVEHAVVLAEDGLLREDHLPFRVRTAAEPVQVPAAQAAQAPQLRDRMADVERADIERALTAENGNQTRAAMRLGISRRALVYKLAKYGLRRV
jgi:DNA-binding NtrC family response regulator